MKIEKHRWTEEEKAYLREIAPNRPIKEIHKMMNERFEYQFTELQVRGAMKRYKIHSGIDTRFQVGHKPPNKGTKGVSKANNGSYKAGNTPKRLQMTKRR